MNGIKMKQVKPLSVGIFHLAVYQYQSLYVNLGILQTREALEAILKDLHGEDRFALIVFDHKILTWRNSLTKATNENITKAIAYVRKIRDDGGQRKQVVPTLMPNVLLSSSLRWQKVQFKSTCFCAY